MRGIEETVRGRIEVYGGGEVKFTISGKLMGLNDMTHKNRFAYGAKKKAETSRCAMATLGKLTKITKPICITVTWYEPNAKRDIDNVAAGVKFILDGLVASGKLENDTRYWVRGITHVFPEIDPRNPRVEIEITEAL